MRVFLIILLLPIYSLLEFTEAASREKSIAPHFFEFSPTQPDQKILFKADKIRHERDLNLIVATGNVEIVQGQRILRADSISYDQKRDLITASGNVTLLEPSGDVLFADHAELVGKSKEGIVENIRILLSDNSRMAAVGGRLTKRGNFTELGKAVYSPCNKCVSDDGTPLWRLKAIQVLHNKIDKTIEYKDAFLELLGFPVLYTPYFTHPDHTVKRKTGFLIPSYGSDSSLGFIIKTPYFFDISPDKDLTLTPVLTGDEGMVLGAEYRQRYSNGILNIKGSGTRGNDAVEQVSNRGHFFSYLDLHLNEVWRLNASTELSTDDTYLRRYKFSEQDTLTNQIHFEGFDGNNYTSVKGILWRGLRQTDDPDKTPFLAPIIDFNLIGNPDVGGGRWNFDTNVLSLTRDDGANSRRLSLRTGWQRPHITPRGDIFNFYSSLQTDVYFVEDVEKLGGEDGTMYSGLVGRVYPQLGFDWQLPLARQNGLFTQIMEPVLGFMISPNGGNSEKIPNEDSKETELDEISLFSRNRYSGIDRVEGGQRVYYGLRLGLLGTNSYTDGFIGQSFRVRRDNNFASGSGLNENFSDLVGKISVETAERFKLNYRFRADKDDFSSRRNEVSGQAKYGGLNFNLEYGFFQKGAGSGEFADREEVSTSLNTLITSAWKFDASTRYDIEKEYTINYKLGLTYLCDCFTMQLDFTKAFTQDRDVAPTDTVFVRFIFKNLGEIHTKKTKGSSFKNQ